MISTFSQALLWIIRKRFEAICLQAGQFEKSPNVEARIRLEDLKNFKHLKKLKINIHKSLLQAFSCQIRNPMLPRGK